MKYYVSVDMKHKHPKNKEDIMEKFYTVDEVAKITMFTTRTIRNYLKDGSLKGRKIGGQWRFTQEDLEQFWEQGKVTEKIISDSKQDVLDFVEGVLPEYTGSVQSCLIVDIYQPIDAITEIKEKLMLQMDTGSGDFKRFYFSYDENDNKARFTLFGPPKHLTAALKIINREDNTQ